MPPSLRVPPQHPPTSPSAFPLAYVCHHNIFLVYNSLKNKTMKTFAIATNISVFTSMAFLGMLGTLGYLTFQGSTQGTPPTGTHPLQVGGVS